MAKKTSTDSVENDTELKFKKEQLLEFEDFKDKKDIINTLITKEYTINETKTLIDNYLKKEVK